MLTILCVDSEQQRLAQLKQDLLPLSARLNIIEATSQQQACELILINTPKIALLLSAEKLKDGDAVTLFKLPQCKLLRKIIYTNTPSVTLLSECINEGHINYFLQLPYQAKELTRIIQTQMSSYKINTQQQSPLHNSIVNKTCLLKVIENNDASDFQDKFIDYSLYSDAELSNIVITYLSRIIEKHDEYNVRRIYSPNHQLTKEGEKNYFLWFIRKGEVMLKKRNAQGEIQDITIMQAGTIVGGMSFLTGEPAFSTGVALETTEVLKVNRTIFSQIMRSNSELLAPFTNLLLRNSNRRLQHSITTELALQETLKSLNMANQQLVESEKMAVLGQLVAGIAHELNNPVAAILRGSDTLISLITGLLSANENSQFVTLAHQILQRGLTIRPLSTSEVRQRTKKLQHIIQDKKTAKLLVTMDLDYQHIPLENNRTLQESTLMLSQYYQIGSILRNSNTCATRMANLVKSLKNYAGQDSDRCRTVDIHEGIEDTLMIFENRLKNYKVIKTYQQLPKIDCHPIELGQVWTNIIANAIDATGEQGTLRISTINLPYDETPNIQIIIEDNGPGIPASIQTKVFELNYTTKREGNFGLGIGLNICSQIIKRHHGTIEIESELDRFTRFIITLPVFNTYTKENNKAHKYCAGNISTLKA